ncbi:MAG: L-amino acid N-acyltransferase YncA [Bacteroidia bacterium]
MLNFGAIDNEFLSTMNYDDRAKRWNKILTQNSPTTFVAVQNDGIIAFASVGENRDKNDYKGEINAIYILKKFGYNGVGTKLFNKVINTY